MQVDVLHGTGVLEPLDGGRYQPEHDERHERGQPPHHDSGHLQRELQPVQECLAAVLPRGEREAAWSSGSTLITTRHCLSR